MEKIKLNDHWHFSAGALTLQDLFSDAPNASQLVYLPHDAMIHEVRSEFTKNAHQTGFYPGNTYTYLKNIDLPESWSDHDILLEFEGVATEAKVYINDCLAAVNVNPYQHFYVPVHPYAKLGQANQIRVEVNNPEQTSRWYTGGGIYRDVYLHVGGPVHLEVDSLKISSQLASSDIAAVSVQTAVKNIGRQMAKMQLHIEIYDPEQQLVAATSTPVNAFAGETTQVDQSLTIDEPRRWSAETPDLYTCRVTLKDKNQQVCETMASPFGIRQLALSAQTGLLVNGQPVNLRGACIHHDNGVLGAATFAEAEERRCLQLKAAGFNCLRSAHHPMSKALLAACDKHGMYVIDELYDMWTLSKNPNDYAQYFTQNWEEDVEKMIAKDFNHPAVIIYSLGNEIQEAGTAFGANWSRRLNHKAKTLDAARYTTTGINGLIAGAAQLGQILQEATGFSDEELAKMFEAPAEDQATGSDEANGMMGMMRGPLADKVATSQTLRDLLEEYTASTDIAGYNYLTALHQVEKDFHPYRVVLGAETFPADIANLWQIVKSESHVIGDMTWAGYDYIGEAGCGIFHYDGTENFTSHWPDRLAGIGDIDLIGNRKPISYYREAVYGLRKQPYLAVTRLNRKGQTTSMTPWMWKDNLASWNWQGFEGETAEVDVYADADEVALYLNGKLIARQAIKDCLATFEVPYQAGELLAVAFEAGLEVGRNSLATAQAVEQIHVVCSQLGDTVETDQLIYLMCQLSDEKGQLNPQARIKIQVQVSGAGELQGMGNADPQALESYVAGCWPTYDGQALIVVRTGQEPGKLSLDLEPEGLQSQHFEWTVN